MGNVTPEEQVFFLRPNPFGRHATLVAWLPSAGNYTLAAYDMFGRVILQENLNATAGLNHIPLELPTADGLVIIALQGNNFRKTLKALQRADASLFDNYYSKINKRLTPWGDAPQHQALNQQLGSGEMSLIVDNQGYGFHVGHDRLPGAQNRQDVLKTDPGQHVTILFESPGHEQKDTLVTFTNHEINKVLTQIPNTVNSTYNLYVFDDTGHVEGASVTVHNVENRKTNNDRASHERRNNNDPLFTGTTNTQGTFTENYEVLEWPWQGQETIRTVDNLQTTIQSDSHEHYQRTDEYQQTLEIQAELERIIEEETATITGSVMSLPHNLPPNTTIKGKHNNEIIVQELNDFAIRAVRYRQQLKHMTKFDHIVDD